MRKLSRLPITENVHSLFHPRNGSSVWGVFSLLLVSWLFLLMPATAGAGDYVLGAEDVVQISVWGNPELGVTVPVRPDGKISLPLGGDIVASGLTPMELRKALTGELSKYLKDPSVSVVVQQINSPKIFLIGNNPLAGAITLRSEMTLLQLIAQLGPVENLDLSRAYIIRDHKRLDFDLRSLVREGNARWDLVLQRGDIIRIPDAFSKQVTVTGEVANPTKVQYRDGLTIVDALIEAGWVTEFANLKKVMVVRYTLEKGRAIFEANVADVQKGRNLEENVFLVPGDMVIVKSGLF